MKKKLLIILVVFLCLMAGGSLWWRNANAYLYGVHPSPDGRFAIRVTAYPQLLGHFPGDSGGVPGFVELVDTRTDEVLERKKVEMVMIVSDVRWESASVDIKLFAEWPLPK